MDEANGAGRWYRGTSGAWLGRGLGTGSTVEVLIAVKRRLGCGPPLINSPFSTIADPLSTCWVSGGKLNSVDI